MIYRLLREHRINKVLRPVGYEIEIADQLGAWWVEQRIAERVDAANVPAIPRPVAHAVPVPRAIAPVAKRFRCCGWK